MGIRSKTLNILARCLYIFVYATVLRIVLNYYFSSLSVSYYRFSSDFIERLVFFFPVEMDENDVEVLDYPDTPEPSEQTSNAAVDLVPYTQRPKNESFEFINLLIYYSP